MKYIPMYKPEVIEGRVVRCDGTGLSFDTFEAAEAAGKADGRPFVVADDKGKVIAV